MNSLLELELELIFTLSMRKILVTLRAMRAPCIRERRQKKRNCMVIARAEGRGANNTEISLPLHWKLNNIAFEYIRIILDLHLLI